MQVHPLTLGDFRNPPEFVVLGVSTFKGPENPQYDYDHVIICHHFQYIFWDGFGGSDVGHSQLEHVGRE